jgi:hypothetical protein
MPPAPDPASERSAPDADGVVRTRRGWRKLLPDILTDHSRDDA